MRGDLTIRKVRTASNATAVQVVRYQGRRCIVVKHIDSAHDEETLVILLADTQKYAEQHRTQPSLFATTASTSKLDDAVPSPVAQCGAPVCTQGTAGLRPFVRPGGLANALS